MLILMDFNMSFKTFLLIKCFATCYARKFFSCCRMLQFLVCIEIFKLFVNGRTEIMV